MFNSSINWLHFLCLYFLFSQVSFTDHNKYSLFGKAIDWLIDLLVFNINHSNISAILWYELLVFQDLWLWFFFWEVDDFECIAFIVDSFFVRKTIVINFQKHKNVVKKFEWEPYVKY
jgi:hypothetical protein